MAELVAEVRTLLANTEFADGQVIILKQDAEAVEAALARVGGATTQRPMTHAEEAAEASRRG